LKGFVSGVHWQETIIEKHFLTLKRP